MDDQKFHFVCLKCRRSVKRAANIGWTGSWDDRKPQVRDFACAECGGAMTFVGRKFAAPRRRDDAGWKKLAWMIENGWRGGAWPVAPAMNLNGVRESLSVNRIARRARLQRENEADSFDLAARRAIRNARDSAAARKEARLELLRQQKYQDEVLARAAKTDA